MKKAVDVRKSNDLKIQIKTIALTVPSQWGLDFQDLYGQLVRGSTYGAAAPPPPAAVLIIRQTLDISTESTTDGSQQHDVRAT